MVVCLGGVLTTVYAFNYCVRVKLLIKTQSCLRRRCFFFFVVFPHVAPTARRDLITYPPPPHGVHSRRLRPRQQQRTRSPRCSAPRVLSRPRGPTPAGASATAALARGPSRRLRTRTRARGRGRQRREVLRFLAGGRKVGREKAGRERHQR